MTQTGGRIHARARQALHTSTEGRHRPRHLIDKEPVSDLADRFGAQPSQVHNWIRQILEQAEKAFQVGPGRPVKPDKTKDHRIKELEAKLNHKNEVIAELVEEHVKLKSEWGALRGAWVPHDTRDKVVDYVNYWTKRTQLPAQRFLAWIGLGTSKFHGWKHRYGKVNEHNTHIPRDWWLQEWEKEAIIKYHDRHPLDGYRRLTFMMLDDDVLAVSPASVYRVLKQARRLDRRRFPPSKKGTGFVQPLRAHEHWNVDVSYINLGGTFYYYPFQGALVWNLDPC